MTRASARRIARTLAVGAALAGLSYLFSWSYCMGGLARGFPFAIVRPSHGHVAYAFLLEPGKVHAAEFVVPALFANWIFWSVGLGIGEEGIARFRAYRRRRLGR